jgi:hypothetical protein
MKDGESWNQREVNPQFLIDSGLLFEINRTVLHPLGLALTVKKDEQGKQALTVKDSRAAPEQLVFSKELRDACKVKLSKFMAEFGNKQIDKRTKALGWACQWVPCHL